MALLEKGGEIRDIHVKPNVRLTEAKILMIPDFAAFHLKLDTIAYFEAKGFESDVWKLKKRLWTVYGPGPMFIYKGNYKKVTLAEVIYPCHH